MAKKNESISEEPLEKQLRKSADKLRKNIDAAEYKHVVLVRKLATETVLKQAELIASEITGD